MKYFKLFLTAFALVIAMSVSAQSKTTAKAKTATTAKAATAAPAKKATTAAKPATTTTKTATASKPAASTKTATASKPAAKKSSSSYSNDYDHGYHFMNELKIGSYYGIGGGFGDNLVLEHEFHKYLAWDIISFDYSMPFNAHFISIGLKTGLRAFTPRFWNGKARGFTSLAMGYDCGIGVGKGYGFGYKGYSGGSGSDLGNFDFGDFDEDDLSGYGGWGDLISSYTGGYTGVDADDYDAGDFDFDADDLIKVKHGFALSWGIGVQFIDRIYVGYALEYSTVSKYTSHYARIGIRF